MSDEPVDVVDRDDRVVATVPRSEMRARKLLHRGVTVAVRNSDGDIFIHRRSSSKDIHPEAYDLFVGGMVGAGEDYASAARRELAEELGIRDVEVRFLFKSLYAGDDNPHWNAMFDVVWEGPLVLQEEEISWGAFVSLEEAKARLEASDLVPANRQLFMRYVAASEGGS